MRGSGPRLSLHLLLPPLRFLLCLQLLLLLEMPLLQLLGLLLMLALEFRPSGCFGLLLGEPLVL